MRERILRNGRLRSRQLHAARRARRPGESGDDTVLAGSTCSECNEARVELASPLWAPEAPAKIRMLRLLTILVIALTLPVYGLAGMTHRSCQEQMSSSDHAAVPGDCCPGKGDPSTDCKQDSQSPLGKNGSCTACKAGYNCKSPQSFEPTHVLVSTVAPAPSTLRADPSPPLVSHSPEGLWRPPRHT
jgi:hypothetical protein